MKAYQIISQLLANLSLGMLAASAQQPAPAALLEASARDAQTSPSTTGAALREENSGSASASSAAGSTTNSTPATPPSETSPSAAKVELTGDKGLRLNFRGVPLDMVLNYLSEAGGFIIIVETKVEGKVDVYSQQPVSKDDAVKLLDTILNKNGYAAIRNDRTLTVVSRDEAKKRNLRVQVGSDPAGIPKTDEMVTQILPVRYANAVQMVKDLQQLLPTYANLTANESANSLVLTDTQSDIRRMAEIIKALDTSIAAIATVRVFPLVNADAKDLALEIKELFPSPSSTGNTQGTRGGGFGAQNLLTRFGGGPGGGAGAATAEGAGQSEARQAASKVTAVADERTNSLIVSAPEEIINVIVELVGKIDEEALNVTILQAFHLKNADPLETAEILNNLFPDDSRSGTGNARSTFQFGRGGFGGGPAAFFGAAGGANTSPTSTRAKQQNRVVATADPRTSTLLVATSKELMEQIKNVINELDHDPAFKQKVFVFSLKSAQVDDVQQVLGDLFQSASSRNSTLNSQNNPFTQRQMNQGYGNNGSTISGTGSGGGTGARRLGQ